MWQIKQFCPLSEPAIFSGTEGTIISGTHRDALSYNPMVEISRDDSLCNKSYESSNVIIINKFLKIVLNWFDIVQIAIPVC